MKTGDLVRFNRTGAIALILEISEEGGYTSMKIHVLGDVLANTACADDYTWTTEHMLQRTAEVISGAR